MNAHLSIKKTELGFGMHLIVDGYRASEQRLADFGLIYSFLNNLPPQIDMHAISPPYVVQYDGGQIPDDCGISAFILIAESHISLHTFPVKKYFSLDIFSCKTFDVDVTISVIQNTFNPASVDWYTFERGKDFPRGCLTKNGSSESPIPLYP